MIRTLLVDDEPLARDRLRRLLQEHPDVEVVGDAGSGGEAWERCLGLRPQLLLLDVDMPMGTGLEALERIRRALPDGLRPLVIFTTAHAEHAVTAFALEGTDYLLKPVEPAGLERALARVRRALWSQPGSTAAPLPTPTVKVAPGAAPTGHLAAFRGEKVINLLSDDVALIEIEDTIPFAVTRDGRFRLHGTLAEVEARLPSPPFVRVSREAIIHLAQVAHLEPLGAGVWSARLRAPLDREVQVARRRVPRLRELLGW
jgi:two-component system LytT family response regulator